MLHQTTFFVCFLVSTGAFRIDQGCMVESDKMEKYDRYTPKLWSEAQVGVWVPREARQIFVAKIIYEDSNYEATRFNLIVSSEDITIEEDGVHKSKFNHSSYPGTFAVYTLGIGTNISLSRDNVTFADFSASTKKLTELKLQGSNLTLNCHSGWRVWQVWDSPIHVPLDGNGEYMFSAISSNKTKTKITLNKEDQMLNGTSTYNLLSTFFNLSCSHKPPRCDIITWEGFSSKIYLNGQLKSIVVQNMDRKPYLLALKQQLPKATETNEQPVINSGTKEDHVNICAYIIAGLIAIIIAMVIALVFYQIKKGKKNPKEIPHDDEEIIPLTTQQSTLSDDENGQLTQAVLDIDVKTVKRLLASGNPPPISATMEAHLRPHPDIIVHFKNTDGNDFIVKVMKELQKRLEAMFKALEKRRYHGPGGLDEEIRRCPPISYLRDKNGRSLLDRMVSEHQNGEPLWDLQCIQNFIKHHEPILNAVDYEGNTCLHNLVCSATLPEARDKEDAWAAIATVLVEAGCNPSIKDHNQILPLNLAQEKDRKILSEQLKENNNESTETSEPSQFKTLLKEIRHGNTTNVRNLLNKGVPLLPIDSKSDPLGEAIARGHLDITLMLLAAGAPLCAKSLQSITPLEVAHASPYGPAVFPAVMRREYINALQFETEKIGNNSDTKELCEFLTRLAEDIERNGHDANWSTENDNTSKRGEKERKFLCAAAQHGLPLTCQVLGLDNVFLHPLVHEDKPVLKADGKKRIEILTILYRDLKMSLFTVNIDLPGYFLNDLVKHENNMLKDFLKKAKCSKEESNFSPESMEPIPNIWLQGIAKLGLVSLCHKYAHQIDIDKEIDDLTKCTMLHLAAFYGQLNMVEYLLYKNANKNALTRHGFSTAHMAALRGNKECWQYIEAYMIGSRPISMIETHQKVTPDMLDKGYEEQVCKNSQILLPEKYGPEILSDVDKMRQIKNLLTKMKIGSIINGEDDELRTHSMCQRFKHADAISTNNDGEVGMSRQLKRYRTNDNPVLKEIEPFLHHVSTKNARFKGKLVKMDPQGDIDYMFPSDSITVYWQVENSDVESLLNHEAETEMCSLTLKGFPLNNFRKEFHENVRESLNDYQFSKNCWLLYPCISEDDIGTWLYFTCLVEGQLHFVKFLLVPVLRVSFPEDNKNDNIRRLIKEYKLEGEPLYLAQEKDNWIYIVAHIENTIFAQLTKTQKEVLTACKYVLNVLYTCWWFPKVHSRRHGRAWGYHARCTIVMHQRLLNTIFLEELLQGNWKEKMALTQRVAAVFERAVQENNQMRKIVLLLDPKHSQPISANKNLLSVISYLKEYKNV